MQWCFKIFWLYSRFAYMGAHSSYYSVKLQQCWICVNMPVGADEFSFLMRRSLS